MVHSNHANWFASFKIMIRPYVFVLSMLLVSRPPFSAWCDMCLSLVRHVSPFSIPGSNTDILLYKLAHLPYFVIQVGAPFTFLLPVGKPFIFITLTSAIYVSVCCEGVINLCVRML